MTARFSAYPLTKHVYARMLRKGGAKKIAKNLTYKRLMDIMVSGGNDDLSAAVQTLQHEAMWQDFGSEAIFLQDQNAYESVKNLKIKDFDPSVLPDGGWLIVMPKSSGLPSFLFTISKHERWKKSVMKNFGAKDIRCDEEWKTERCFSVAFKQNDFTYHRNADFVSFFNPSYNEPFDAHGIYDHALSPEENEMMAEMAQLGFKTLVYQMIFPEKTHEGSPHFNGTTQPIPMRRKALSGVGGSPGVTAVGLHFRQLRAPRYYKGEYADRPVGTRFVKVMPHVRGAKKATTIEE